MTTSKAQPACEVRLLSKGYHIGAPLAVSVLEKLEQGPRTYGITLSNIALSGYACQVIEHNAHTSHQITYDVYIHIYRPALPASLWHYEQCYLVNLTRLNGTVPYHLVETMELVSQHAKCSPDGEMMAGNTLESLHQDFIAMNAGKPTTRDAASIMFDLKQLHWIPEDYPIGKGKVTPRAPKARTTEPSVNEGITEADIAAYRARKWM